MVFINTIHSIPLGCATNYKRGRNRNVRYIDMRNNGRTRTFNCVVMRKTRKKKQRKKQ